MDPPPCDRGITGLKVLDLGLGRCVGASLPHRKDAVEGQKSELIPASALSGPVGRTRGIGLRFESY